MDRVYYLRKCSKSVIHVNEDLAHTIYENGEISSELILETIDDGRWWDHEWAALYLVGQL